MPSANSTSLVFPRFEVAIDGKPLSDEVADRIVEITVDDDINLPSMFVLEVVDSEQQREETQWIDSDLFSIGKVLEVKMGYEQDLATLIVGEITGLEPRFTFDSPPSLTVRGYDRRHLLQRGRKTRTFVKQKDSAIATQIASEAGLTAQVIDSEIVHEYVLQADRSDLEFLQERARRIQYEVFVNDKTLFFRPVAIAGSKVLTLTLENDLLEFYPRLSAMGQVSEITLRGWSFKNKKAIVGRASTGNEVSKMGGQKSGGDLAKSAFGAAVEIVSDRPLETQAEANQMAKALFNQNVLGLIAGEGVCRGRTELRAGKTIEIGGIGKRFSGLYYAIAASHRYGPRGYYTHFTVRRNAL